MDELKRTVPYCKIESTDVWYNNNTGAGKQDDAVQEKLRCRGLKERH